jgi:hypothetical protein
MLRRVCHEIASSSTAARALYTHPFVPADKEALGRYRLPISNAFDE